MPKQTRFAHERLRKGTSRPIELEGHPGVTELVTNRRIEWMERYRPAPPSLSLRRIFFKEGLLRPGDHVVVWAKEFLDDELLFENTVVNLAQNIGYIYILDRMYLKPFQDFLKRLRGRLGNSIVDARVDVVFVKPILTMNNFVLLAPDTERETLYSALIHDQKPFAWIRQTGGRAVAFRLNVVDIFRQLALAQANNDPDDRCRPFNRQDQTMDFGELGRDLLRRGGDPYSIHFHIKDIASKVSLPGDADAPDQGKGRFTE